MCGLLLSEVKKKHDDGAVQIIEVKYDISKVDNP
jgi:hypothetical protein